MAVNWMHGWKSSTRRPDKRIQVRRQELSLDTLEDRSVPATAIALTDATSAPPVAGHDGETTVSINPTDTNNIIVGANYLGELFGNQRDVTGTTSTGAGPYALVPIPNTGTAAIGDPVVRHFSDGRALYTHMEFDGVNGATIGMFSAVSNDGGLTYTKGTITPIGSGDDKQEVAIGPDVNNLGQERAYVAWHRGNVIFTSSSTDGINWSAPVQASAGFGNINAQLAVDGDGVVYMIYDNFTTAGVCNITFTRSTDGGLTWSPETVIETSAVEINYAPPAQPNRGIWAIGNIAVDRSGGAFDGRLYAVFTDEDRDNPAFADLDIYLMFSDDQGNTWSTPEKVDDGGTTNSTFFPRVEVDQTTGNVAVTFYDGRNGGPANVLMEFWGAVSDPGGESFTPNFMISQGQTNILLANDGNDYGDYSGLSFTNGILAAAWSDNTNSGGENPDGAGAQSDAYVRTFQVGAAAAGRDLVAFDLSRSMVALYGLDINVDGVVDDADDFNEKGLEGSLIDASLFDYFQNAGGETGIIAFARRAEALNMTPNGDKFTSTVVDSDGDGETDVLETLKSLTKGGGGYFGTVDVNEDPTILEGVLANILIYGSPGDRVTIYTDGASRFDPAASTTLQSLIQAGISVNVVLVGPYQTIVDTTNIEQIAILTGGQVRRLNNFDGRPADGGFPTTVTGGGTGNNGGGGGSNPLGGGGFGGGSGAGGGSGSGSGGGGGSGGSGSGGSGSGGSGEGGSGSGGSGSGSGGGAGASGGETDGDGAQLLAAAAAAESDGAGNTGGASAATTVAAPVITYGQTGMLIDGKPAFLPFQGEDGNTYRWVFMKNSLVNGPVKMRIDSRGMVMFTKPATPAPTQTPAPAPGNFPGPQPIYRPEDYGLAYVQSGGTTQSGTPSSGDGTTQEPPKDEVPTDDPPVTGSDDGANTGGNSSGGTTTGNGGLPTLDPDAPLDGADK